MTYRREKGSRTRKNRYRSSQTRHHYRNSRPYFSPSRRYDTAISSDYPDKTGVKINENAYSERVTCLISTFLNGLSPLSVGTAAIMSTISSPLVTFQKTECLPSSHDVSSAWTIKNWLPFVFGPAFAIEIYPFL